MTGCVTVFEYDMLTDNPEVQHPRCALISRSAFDYLENLCLKNSEDDKKSYRFLELRSCAGSRVIRVSHYVGVIRTPDGQQIEILPKTARYAGKKAQEEAREALLNMLRCLPLFRHLETAEAAVAQQSMPLPEIFIRQFLHSVNRLVKRGLHSAYVCQEDNLPFMKGKLLMPEQLKYNQVNRQGLVALPEFKFRPLRHIKGLDFQSLFFISGVWFFVSCFPVFLFFYFVFVV
ncbi:hypothetical protein CI610_02170 [invertebrate metagenome]|uniref:Uncharacterized protein n=1 Tax=invertebrate metagenome TaxID=1711999 RepID=A0A2H9T6Q1_9ZZZZ